MFTKSRFAEWFISNYPLFLTCITRFPSNDLLQQQKIKLFHFIGIFLTICALEKGSLLARRGLVGTGADEWGWMQKGAQI